jgi:hypothetical protein
MQHNCLWSRQQHWISGDRSEFYFYTIIVDPLNFKASREALPAEVSSPEIIER